MLVARKAIGKTANYSAENHIQAVKTTRNNRKPQP